MSIKVKICGITSEISASTALRLGVDFIGATFYKESPRNITVEKAAQIFANVPQNKIVAVVSEPEEKLIKNIISKFKPQYIQFDDFIAPEKLGYLKKKYGFLVIKTVYIGSEDYLKSASEYDQIADIINFEGSQNNDAFVEYSENSLDWSLVKKVDIDVPKMISGGLNKYNVKVAKRQSGANIINASATLELTPGVKDPKLIEEFVKAVRIKSYL